MTDVIWSETTDPTGRSVLEFTLNRPNRRKVTGALWLPKKGVQTHVIACFGHGASGDRYQPPIVPLAHRFLDELRCPVLSLDGPVHGLRQVGPGGRETLGPELFRDDCVVDMVEEWNAAIDLVSEKAGLKDYRIAYFGLSMGSIFGIPFLATRTDVAVATLGLAGVFEGLPHQEEMALAAEKLTAPVFFLMQLEDELFPRDAYLALFDRIASPDKRIHANPGLHPNIAQDEVDFAFEFMAAHIEGGGGRTVVKIAE